MDKTETQACDDSKLRECPCQNCDGQLLPEREADPCGTEDYLICPKCGYCPEEEWDHLIADCPLCSAFSYIINQGNIRCSGCGLELTAKDEPSAIAAWNERTPRPDNALADELASELYKEHASFLHDKDAHDWDELPEVIKIGWMNEAHKRLEPVLRYISPAAVRSTPPEAEEIINQ